MVTCLEVITEISNRSKRSTQTVTHSQKKTLNHFKAANTHPRGPGLMRTATQCISKSSHFLRTTLKGITMRWIDFWGITWWGLNGSRCSASKELWASWERRTTANSTATQATDSWDASPSKPTRLLWALKRLSQIESGPDLLPEGRLMAFKYSYKASIFFNRRFKPMIKWKMKNQSRLRPI